MGKNQPKTQVERFEEVRAEYATREDFRASIEAENVATLRASAKEFEINLEGRDKKSDILDGIVNAIYGEPGSDNANAPAGGVEGAGEGEGGENGDNADPAVGNRPTPAHDDKTAKQNKAGGDKDAKGKGTQPSDADLKKASDSTTIDASNMKGAKPGDVVQTTSAENPNSDFTESNEEKKKTRSARALAGQGQ